MKITDATAEIASFCSDGSFLVIACSNGVVHFLDVGSSRKLFSQTLMKPPKSGAAFVSAEFSPPDITGAYDLLVLSTSGNLFQFSGIDLTKLRTAIEAGDVASAKEVSCRWYRFC